MKIVIVSDAWLPQTNGVVRTLSALRQELLGFGHDVVMITPENFTTIPCPTYGEIRLALVPGFEVDRILTAYRPDAIHVATEGPLGYAARRFCRSRKLPFTTSFHTKFPDYIKARFGVPMRWTYALLRRFHAAASATMVATDSVRRELEGHGFGRLKRWTRGVDMISFRPMAPGPYSAGTASGSSSGIRRRVNGSKPRCSIQWMISSRPSRCSTSAEQLSTQSPSLQ